MTSISEVVTARTGRATALHDPLFAASPRISAGPDRDQADAVGLTGRRRAAAIEAAAIRTALHRRRQNMPPAWSMVGGNVATPHNDLASELRWLTQVSDALARDEPHRAPRS